MNEITPLAKDALPEIAVILGFDDLKSFEEAVKLNKAEITPQVEQESRQLVESAFSSYKDLITQEFTSVNLLEDEKQLDAAIAILIRELSEAVARAATFYGLIGERKTKQITFMGLVKSRNAGNKDGKLFLPTNIINELLKLASEVDTDSIVDTNHYAELLAWVISAIFHELLHVRQWIKEKLDLTDADFNDDLEINETYSENIAANGSEFPEAYTLSEGEKVAQATSVVLLRRDALSRYFRSLGNVDKKSKKLSSDIINAELHRITQIESEFRI